MYGWIVLQLMLMYFELFTSKIYLNNLGDIDVSQDNTKEVIIVHVQEPLRSKSLTIEDLEPSRSLVLQDSSSVQNDLSVEDLNLNNAQKDILRKRWQSSCDRKAAKVCIKACKGAAKDVCSSYLCKRSMKRTFKRECKRNCKSHFVSSRASDTE